MALLIGLTGGIGSGKSTVSALLAERGAHVINADDLARRALRPGSDAHALVGARFGVAVTGPDGTLDRQALARIVFNDEVARADLEAIVHPLVNAAIDARLAELASRDALVVLESPLLVETRAARRPLAGLLVVDAPEDLALDRLVRMRAMDEADARARIAAQASRTERIQLADFVIMNMGTLDELVQMVDECWSWIEGLRAEQRAGGPR